MWPLVREGVRFYRAVLLITWTSCVAGVAAVFAVLALLGVIDSRHGLLWGATVLPVYLLVASSVAGWIALGGEMSEHRLRLHLLLPLSAREGALAQILLPATLLSLGLPLAHAVAVVVRLFGADSSAWLRHDMILLAFVHLLCLQQLAFALKEVTVLRELGWGRMLPALVGFCTMVLAQDLLGLPRGPIGLRIVSVAGIALLTAAGTLAFFTRRPDLAR